jgi:hypothetical protein
MSEFRQTVNLLAVMFVQNSSEPGALLNFEQFDF